METGFHVDTPWIELGFRLRLGRRTPFSASLRAFWRWIRSTLGVRLGFAPPPRPTITHAKVESLDEGFAAFRQLRGAPPVERGTTPPRTPSDLERYRVSRRATARSRPPRRPRPRRPSGSGEIMFGVTPTRRQEIRGRTREWRRQLEPDNPLPEDSLPEDSPTS